MKKTQIIAVALTSLLFTSGAALAGGGHHGGHWDEGKMEKKLDRMTKNLDLTSEQRNKVEGLFKAKHEKRKAEREKMKEKMKADRDQFHKEMKAILTAEQFEKFEAQAKERQEKMDKKREKKRKKKE